VAVLTTVRRARIVNRAPLLALLAGAVAGTAGARVLADQAEALARAFPGATVERASVILGDAEAARVEELAGSALASRVVSRYRASRDGELVGTAYFEVHMVRTLREVVMVVVDRAGQAARVEVLRFDEPPEYLPRERWFEQFRGRELDDDLDLGRGIRAVTGATLSSRAATASVRRALAVHRVLEEGKR
jgi:hypothetical protein